MSVKKCDAVSEISNETVTQIKSYTISREIDSHAKDFDKVLKNLQKQYGFDLETEIFNIDDL